MSNGFFVLDDYLEEKEEHVSHTFPGQKTIRVIEYSAYNQLAYELDKSRSDHFKKINQLTEQNKIMRSALERLLKIDIGHGWNEFIIKALEKCGSTEPTALKARIVMKGELPPLPFDGEKDD